jgi:hypothetical protein
MNEKERAEAVETCRAIAGFMFSGHNDKAVELLGKETVKIRAGLSEAIEQRNAAEETIDSILDLIPVRHEWSNGFDYTNAINAVEASIDNIKAETAKAYALLEQAAEEACDRVRKDILPCTPNHLGSHPPIDRVCALIKGWEYRVPEDKMNEIQCPYTQCNWGQGLAGQGKCSGYGNPMDAKCPNFTTEADDYSQKVGNE